MTARLPKEVYKLKNLQKKSLAFAIFVLALVIFVFCACTYVTAGIDKIPNKITIQNDRMPLTEPGLLNIQQESFKTGADVETVQTTVGSLTIDWNMDDFGLLAVSADINTGKKLKLKVTKDDIIYYYNLTPFEKTHIPLQSGSGSYKVEFFENISGTEYQRLFGKQIDVSISDPNTVFLYASQMVNFDSASDAAAFAHTLTKNSNNNTEKANAIYEYLVKNITYDYEKIKTISSNYIPDADTILKAGSGICYDYAVLMAAMLRETGIPAKLVMGYRNGLDNYHAWNEVLLKGEWITVDATFDAVEYRNGRPYSLQKEAGLYTVQKIF